MINKIYNYLKKNLAYFLQKAFTFSAVHTVNTACLVGYGQIEEPSSLNRFKKNI